MKLQCYLLIIGLCFVACKKDTPAPAPEQLSENQQKIQGKWTQVYFKRYDYSDGTVSRVVEGEVNDGNYVEFFGNNYRFHNGQQLIDEGNTFAFDGDELAIRNNNTIFYSTIRWASSDSYIETRDDGSSAGGPAFKSVFEYTYIRLVN
jgi:hypothetical protein